jgi:hypothetical protein
VRVLADAPIPSGAGGEDIGHGATIGVKELLWPIRPQPVFENLEVRRIVLHIAD